MSHQFKVGDRVRLKPEYRSEIIYGRALTSGEVQTVGTIYDDAGTARIAESGACVLLERLEPVPPPALIDPAKVYQTRDGRKVRIYATDGAGTRVIHGAVNFEGQWAHKKWYADGKHGNGRGEGPLDLIEVKPERECWINLYPHQVKNAPGYRNTDCAAFHASREIADTEAGAGRIACLHVKFREGDGL